MTTTVIATEEELLPIYHRKKGIRKSYHKALRCTSSSHANPPVCSNIYLYILRYLPTLFMLQIQSSRSLSCSVCPSAVALKKLKSFRKTHKPLFTTFQMSRKTFTFVEEKKKRQNIILARLTSKQSKEIKAQEILF